MFRQRIEGVHVEEGRCSGGEWKMFMWRMEYFQA
jgi:hypothetical protein